MVQFSFSITLMYIVLAAKIKAGTKIKDCVKSYENGCL